MSDRIVRLQSSYSCYATPEGGYELVSIARGKRLTLRLPKPKAEPLIAALSAGVRGEDAASVLASRAGLPVNTVQRLLGKLEGAGALVQREPQDDLSSLDGTSLYDRQIRFLSFYETPVASGIELNRRLQDRKVVITGVGGLGGWIALLCARVGISNIVGIDPDRVELSNLHRQILYTRSDIGELKVEACKKALSAVDEDICFTGLPIRISEPEDILEYLDGADLVINPFPYLPSFADVARAVSLAALQARVPCLNMPVPQCLGPLTIPGSTACFACAWEKVQERYRFDYATQASTPAWGKQGFLAALAPRQAIYGGLAAWEAVRFLSGMEKPPTLDGTMWLDIGTYQQHGFVLTPRNPDCTVCGDAKAGDRNFDIYAVEA